MTTLPYGVTFRVGKTLWTPNDLVHSTETQGGLKECKFSLPSNGQTIEIDDQLVIYDSQYQRYPFVGRIVTIHKTGICFDFTATRSTRLRPMKFSVDLSNPTHPTGSYAGRIYKSGTPIMTTITDALQLCEDVFQGNVVTLSQQYIADSNNMGGYTAEQMWNFICDMFGQLGTPLLWHIRTVAPGLQVLDLAFQDTAARYVVTLPEDQIEEEWDSEQIITGVAVEYGNDQIYTLDLPHISNARRKLIHEKYINAGNAVARPFEALAVASSQLSQYGAFISTSGKLTLNCNIDIVAVKPPITTVPLDNWPLHLLESGHGIMLRNRSASLYPYNENLKFIIGTEYNWDSGVLTATCGTRPGGLSDRVESIVGDYSINRLFNGAPGVSHPGADADLIPQAGPEITGGEAGSPPSTSYAIPAFRDGVNRDGSDPNVPYGKQIDPDLVADEGLEANVNFDPQTEGFQAAIRVVPGTFNEYRLLLGDSSGLVNDTCVGELYKVIPPSLGGGTQLLTGFTSTGLKDTGPKTTSPAVTLTRGDYYMIKVTTTSSTATWAALSLHAKKNFPALKS